MRNPAYIGPFEVKPRRACVCNMRFASLHGKEDAAIEHDQPVLLSIGIKTTISTRDGVKILPTKEVVFEINQGDEVASFPVSPDIARTLARNIVEFADHIEEGGEA